MLASRGLLFRRFVEDANAPFHEKCQSLKNKFRGKGQFRSSQNEAISFLDTNVGRNLEEWLTVKNAISALSVMSFFEIEHPYKAEIAYWLSNKMGTLTVQEKLDAGIVMVSADHSKYVDTVVANIVNPLVRHAVPGMSVTDLSIFCKIMQRCGNTCPTEAWTTVASHVQRRLTSDVSMGELVRFFSGFARRIPDSPVTLAILRTLVENASSLKAFDYSTVVASAGRLHITNPLPLDLFTKLASHASDFGSFLNARDIGTILSTLMRVRMSYKPTEENLVDLWMVDNTIQVVMHSLSRTVSRFMDPNDERSWSGEADIVSLVFAYESSGTKFPDVYKSFSDFVNTNLKKMEARNIALSLGILRRTGFLTDDLAQQLSDRCGAVMDDFNAPELSHVVFTFLAVRGEYPKWLDRAKARISSLLTTDTPIHCRLNIRASFPGDAGLVSNVDLTQISLRQLHDVLKAANIDTELRADAERQIAVTLEGTKAPSCAEVEVMLDIGKNNLYGLGGIVREVSRNILNNEKWPVDVAALANLFEPSERPDIAKKAVLSAATYCKSPIQFASFARTLLATFPESIEVRDWVARGANEIVKPRSGVQLQPALDILDIVNSFELEMGKEWYTALLYGPISENASRLTIAATLVVLKMIQQLGVPSSHGEPVAFLLQQASERARKAEEILPAFVAAAQLQCVALDEGWCKKILLLPNLSEEERLLFEQAKKAPSSLKSLSRQESNKDDQKKIVVSGANSGGAAIDAMADTFEDSVDQTPAEAVELSPASSQPIEDKQPKPANVKKSGKKEKKESSVKSSKVSPKKSSKEKRSEETKNKSKILKKKNK